MDLSGSYSCMSVNSDLSLVNSDLSLVNSDLSSINSNLSSLSVGRVFCLSAPSIYLSINLYLRSYHNLVDQSCPHHARGTLHNYYIGHNMK